MPLIQRDNVTAGQYITATLFNDELNKIHNLVNGSLDRDNIATNQVCVPATADFLAATAANTTGLRAQIVFPTITALQNTSMTGFAVSRHRADLAYTDTQAFGPRYVTVSCHDKNSGAEVWSYVLSMATNEQRKAIDLAASSYQFNPASHVIYVTFAPSDTNPLTQWEKATVHLWVTGVIVASTEA